jgi:carboxyl-terminal processing protease
VLLVNEHSTSAAEMVTAFASEYGLATFVGNKTPGRLVMTSVLKVGHGYRVASGGGVRKGANLEGRGIVPDIEQLIETAALWQGQDTQLHRAMLLAAGC